MPLCCRIFQQPAVNQLALHHHAPLHCSLLPLQLPSVPQEYLCTWPKTVVVVSHARDFLNTVATDIVHLHSRKLTVYKGNYDTFEKTAAERLRNMRKQAESQQKARDHMQVRDRCGGYGRLGIDACVLQEMSSSFCVWRKERLVRTLFM